MRLPQSSLTDCFPQRLRFPSSNNCKTPCYLCSLQPRECQCSLNCYNLRTHPLKTSTEHPLKFLIFLHPCTLRILRSKERLPTLFELLISPKLLPCVCVVVSQIKAKVNGKKYGLKHYIYFQELGSIMSLALFYTHAIFLSSLVDFRGTQHKTV